MAADVNQEDLLQRLDSVLEGSEEETPDETPVFGPLSMTMPGVVQPEITAGDVRFLRDLLRAHVTQSRR